MSQPAPLTFRFNATVIFDPAVADGYMKHYVPIPHEVSAALDAAGVTHVEGSLNNTPFRRVIHPRDDGSRCLKFGKIWLEQAGLAVDAAVTVELAPDPDPGRIDLPEALTFELMQSPGVMERWAALSPSMQKTLAYHIERAKRPETRSKRAQQIVRDLMSPPDDRPSADDGE